MRKINGSVRALHDHVIVSDLQVGERISRGGIVLLDDNAKSTGIRPRWAQVHVVGAKQTDVEPGQWVLVEHGRWTRGFKLENDQGVERTVYRVDVDAILAVSDQKPTHDDTINSSAA
jgi:co-chaperonin GroES (HSP10)